MATDQFTRVPVDNNCFNLPLFPLSAHILPGGRMALRIFEPRYVRMVKQACASQSGFGICMYKPKGDKEQNSHIHTIGTYVTVVDFDLLEDGLLGVTVEAKNCFKIDSITTETDELRIGRCQWLDSWQSALFDEAHQVISSRLKDVFEKYPEIRQLYPHTHFDDVVWVIYRWLELIPINAEQKQQLIEYKDCSKAFEFLSQLVE
jgi:Lon protease-like protein